jgi:hypothetical protein
VAEASDRRSANPLGGGKENNPDFVAVDTEGIRWLIEVKRDKDMPAERGPGETRGGQAMDQLEHRRECRCGLAVPPALRERREDGEGLVGAAPAPGRILSRQPGLIATSSQSAAATSAVMRVRVSARPARLLRRAERQHAPTRHGMVPRPEQIAEQRILAHPGQLPAQQLAAEAAGRVPRRRCGMVTRCWWPSGMKAARS